MVSLHLLLLSGNASQRDRQPLGPSLQKFGILKPRKRDVIDFSKSLLFATLLV